MHFPQGEGCIYLALSMKAPELLSAGGIKKVIVPLLHHNCWATFYKEFISWTRRSCENSPKRSQNFIIDLAAMKNLKVSVHFLIKKSTSPACAPLFIVGTVSTLIKSVKVEYDTLWDIDLA